MEIKNAKIDSTFFGIEDHGIMTFMLHLDYGGTCQGAGGYALDGYDKKLERRVGDKLGVEVVRRILDIVGVDRWEDLPGKHIRVKAQMCKVHAIGNLLKDDWLDFTSFFENQEL